MSALDEIITRAQCIVDDGGRDTEKIIRECYDLEVYDDFSWSLLKAVFNPGELIARAGVEEELVQYCIDELTDEVQDMIDEAEDKEAVEEALENIAWDYNIDLDMLDYRERDVLKNIDLDRTESKEVNGHSLFTFYHTDGEHSFEWDETQQKITG